MNSTNCNESELRAEITTTLIGLLASPSMIMQTLIAVLAIPLNAWYIVSSRRSSTTSNIDYMKRIMAISNIAVSFSYSLG